MISVFNIPLGNVKRVEEAIQRSLQWLDFEFADHVKLLPQTKESATRKVSLRYALDSPVTAEQIRSSLDEVGDCL